METFCSRNTIIVEWACKMGSYFCGWGGRQYLGSTAIKKQSRACGNNTPVQKPTNIITHEWLRETSTAYICKLLRQNIGKRILLSSNEQCVVSKSCCK